MRIVSRTPTSFHPHALHPSIVMSPRKKDSQAVQEPEQITIRCHQSHGCKEETSSLCGYQGSRKRIARPSNVLQSYKMTSRSSRLSLQNYTTRARTASRPRRTTKTLLMFLIHRPCRAVLKPPNSNTHVTRSIDTFNLKQEIRV